MESLQRSPEWFFDRSGMLTASNFAAAIGICPFRSRAQLWREITGKAEKFKGSPATDWGTENEKNAIACYEIISGNFVEPVGFIKHPNINFIGGSPDGFVDQDGCIEAKCPFSGKNHEAVPLHYQCQIQGVLEIVGRKWCDFISWIPGQTNVIRVERDVAYWKWMLPLLEEFWQYVKENKEPPRLKRKPVYLKESTWPQSTK